MNDILLMTLGIAALIGIALIFEESRDYLLDAFEYIISFEWIEDAWDFISGIFDNLGEFSIGGLVFGLSSAGLIYFLRKWMLHPFLEYMTKPEAIFWTIATYSICGVVGYLFGKRMFDD